ncbi:MAG: oxidoreductase, partial [Actinomycetes bacterium]
LERYRDGLGTKPRVYYKNLYRWTQAFVACAAVFGDTDECAEGATATVEHDGVLVGTGTCDNFGEVTVDKLEPGKEYAVRIEAPGYKAATAPVKLDKSTNLGTLFLEKA